MAVIASAIGKEMGLSPLRCKLLHYAGVVHDLGKVAIPSEILNKPGRLSHPEVLLIRTHVEHGVHILKDAGFCTRVLDVISMHHEYMDGSGYPGGLTGDAIEARILTVADIYEAMTAHRTYRPSLGSETALAELRSGSGSRFDPQVIAALEVILARIGNLESLDALGE